MELIDRDDVPVDVSVFRIVDGKPVEYLEGQDPVAQPHEVQALPGNKFAPRVLRDKGAYYVRVRASHPEYKLRTRVYDAPPYRNPQDAVRAAVDYIMGAGDSWFANTPRRGGSFDRVGGAAPGDVAVRGLPCQPLFAAGAVVLAGQRLSAGAAAAAALSGRALLQQSAAVLWLREHRARCGRA